VHEALDTLKAALAGYWGFMKESPYLGFILTLCTIEMLKTIFGPRRAPRVRNPDPAPSPPLPEPPPPPPIEPVVEEGPSRMERLLKEDD